MIVHVQLTASDIPHPSADFVISEIAQPENSSHPTVRALADIALPHNGWFAKMGGDKISIEFSGPTPGLLDRLNRIAGVAQVSHPIELDIIGDGAAALIAVHDLVEQYYHLKLTRENASRQAPQLRITIIGQQLEEVFGRGFAYGIAGKHGHMTQLAKHCEYSPQRAGMINKFFAGTTNETVVPRDQNGAYLHSLYLEAQKLAARAGITVTYQQATATAIESLGNNNGVVITTADGKKRHADFAYLAVGDLPSNAFKELSETSNNRIFYCPYRTGAVQKILDDNRDGKVVAVRGSRSSMVDLALGLFYPKEGDAFKGQLVAFSRTGIIPYVAPSEKYVPQRLNEGFIAEHAGQLKLADVLAIIQSELLAARDQGYWVPQALITALAPQNRIHHQSFSWAAELKEELAHASTRNYHHVFAHLNFNGVFAALASDGERKSFAAFFGKFVRYHKTNCVVPSDFAKLAKLITDGRLQIRRGEINEEDVQLSKDGNSVRVHINDFQKAGAELVVDQLVVCSNGPYSSGEMLKSSPLLDSAHSNGLIEKSAFGGGFITTERGQAVALLGAQGLVWSGAGLGIESYGGAITRANIALLARIEKQFHQHATHG